MRKDELGIVLKPNSFKPFCVNLPNPQEINGQRYLGIDLPVPTQ